MPWSLCGTLITLVTAGGTTQKGSNNLGDFLGWIADNFVMQVIEKPTRKGALLDKQGRTGHGCESQGQPCLQ